MSVIPDLDRPDDEHRLAAMHDRLIERAAAANALDVSYRTVDSPLGSLLLAATPRGLVRVAFSLEPEQDVLAELADNVSPRVLHAPARLDTAARQLDDYFAGRRRTFDLPVDLTLIGGFRRQVVALLPRIRYGETVSYGAVATMIGNPGATRAVGTACAKNPIPLVLPCHRVVRSDGSTGAYRGGPQVKVTLLTMERALAESDRPEPAGSARSGGR